MERRYWIGKKEGSVSRYRALVQRLKPDSLLMERGRIESPGRYCGWFEFRHDALDEPVYNLFGLAGTSRYMVLYMSSCPFEQRQDWMALMHEVMKSVREVGLDG